MQELKVATVFSGIGALEESLKQLKINHVIKFACDNGEREPKTDLKTLYKVAKNVLSDSRAEELIRLYINIIFAKRKIKNAILEVIRQKPGQFIFLRQGRTVAQRQQNPSIRSGMQKTVNLPGSGIAAEHAGTPRNDFRGVFPQKIHRMAQDLHLPFLHGFRH